MGTRAVADTDRPLDRWRPGRGYVYVVRAGVVPSPILDRWTFVGRILLVSP